MSHQLQRLRDVEASRPPSGSAPARMVTWLNAKAAAHDAVARHAERAGDIPTAVRHQVLGARARLDTSVFSGGGTCHVVAVPDPRQAQDQADRRARRAQSQQAARDTRETTHQRAASSAHQADDEYHRWSAAAAADRVPSTGAARD